MANSLGYDSPSLRVARAIEDEKITFGGLLSYEWLASTLGLRYPYNVSQFRTPSELAKAQKAWHVAIKQVKAHLAQELNMHLRTVTRRGYVIVEPKDQTKWAETSLRGGMRRLCNKTESRLLNIDLSLLSQEEREENFLARSRLGFIKQACGKKSLDELMSLPR